MYYDKEGNKITFEECVQKRSIENYHRIALTEVGCLIISTIWLGIEHGFNGGLPLIFETMVYDKLTKGFMGECYRYTTEASALQGHEQVVSVVKKGMIGFMGCQN